MQIFNNLFGTARPSFVVCSNLDIVSTSAKTVKEFLLTAPKGVYTTVRCTPNYLVFDLETHLNRLLKVNTSDVTSGNTSFDPTPLQICAQTPDNTVFIADQIRECMKTCAEEVIKLHPNTGATNGLANGSPNSNGSTGNANSSNDVRITVLFAKVPIDADMSHESLMELETQILMHENQTDAFQASFYDNYSIVCLGENLPAIKEGAVPVVCREFRRGNPTVKSMQFAEDREVIEKIKGVCQESLLVSGDSIMEGGSSNFFAMYKDGSLRTASERDVLSGTVRQLVIDVINAAQKPIVPTPSVPSTSSSIAESCFAGCVKSICGGDASPQQKKKDVESDAPVPIVNRDGDLSNVKLVYDAPKISEIDQWKACFITSTSRLLLPVNAVVVPTADGLPVDNLDTISGRQRVYTFDSVNDPTVRKCQEDVNNAILSRSYSIAEPMA